MKANWGTWITIIFISILILPACQSGESQDSAPPSTAREPSPSTRPKIVALGDSLTAGYGMSLDQAYPARLQERLDSEGYNLEVVNAGVPGDTTAGGVSRLDWVLDGDVRVLIVALGGNDGLRGLPVSEMKKNLSTIIKRATQRGITVLLAGMEAPPNQGEEYTAQFRKTFQDLAREHSVVFMPFLLEGVGGMAELNQADGIHPNAEGAAIMADNLWEYIYPLLESVQEP